MFFGEKLILTVGALGVPGGAGCRGGRGGAARGGRGTPQKGGVPPGGYGVPKLCKKGGFWG